MQRFGIMLKDCLAVLLIGLGVLLLDGWVTARPEVVRLDHLESITTKGINP